MDVLRAFTGNDELAVQAKNADQLRELIKLLAVTSSQIGSRRFKWQTASGRDRGTGKAAGTCGGDSHRSEGYSWGSG